MLDFIKFARTNTNMIFGRSNSLNTYTINSKINFARTNTITIARTNT